MSVPREGGAWAARMILRQRKHAFGPSVCPNNRRNTTRSASRVENLDHAGHELSGNDAVVVASRRDDGARLQIDAGPDEAMNSVTTTHERSSSSPRCLFRGAGNSMASRGSEGGVCVIGNTVTTILPSTERVAATSRAGAVLDSFLRPVGMFVGPQIRVMDDQTDFRIGSVTASSL